MDNIVDNLQTREKFTYEDVRAKLLDISANRSVAGNSKTAFRVQRLSDSHSSRTHAGTTVSDERTALGAKRG